MPLAAWQWCAQRPLLLLFIYTYLRLRTARKTSSFKKLLVAPKPREECPPTTPCICDSLNEHRLTGGGRHGLGRNP